MDYSKMNEHWFPVAWSDQEISNPLVSFGRFYPTQGKYLRIVGFFSPQNELSSKMFLDPSTNAPIPLFLFKLIAKPPFKVALEQDRKILEICQEHR